MSRYLYSVKSVKYGTVTGTNTIPVSLTQLPDTVKGSVTIDETEGSSVEFKVDQKKNPIKVVKVEEGQLTTVMQFYDFTYNALAAFKGGTSATGGGTGSFAFIPATGYTDVNKALVMELDSGEKLNIYNGNCFARITGGGGRDKMLSWELKVTPQMTADLAGSWDIETP
jgi:hypothetical protein